MISVTYTELDEILSNSLKAFSYAEDNYNALKERQVFHTLYGAKSLDIGAASPSSLTSARERNLTKATKRKTYTVYELDQDYQIMCNRIIRNGITQYSYLHFELEGIRYARAFFGDGNVFYTNVVHCQKYSEKGLVYYAQASPSMLYIEFYEMLHEGDGKDVIVTAYLYYPNRTRSEIGTPISRNAPLGAPDSPVTVSCYEDTLPNTDFSKWFIP